MRTERRATYVAFGLPIAALVLMMFMPQPQEPERHASALTSAQLATLKTDIQADGTLNGQPNNSDGAAFIVAAYNVTSSPDYWVWKTRVTKSELVNSTSIDATTFNWSGNGFITRSSGEISAFQEIFDASGAVNPSQANVRQAFADIFSGTGNAAANRTHLLTVARRKATRVEKLFAIDTPGSGAGRGTTADPDTMVVEGSLTINDVETARNLP